MHKTSIGAGDTATAGTVAATPAAASTTCSMANGSRTQNVLPEPGVLSTPMVPPIASTSRLLRAKPMPVPSMRR